MRSCGFAFFWGDAQTTLAVMSPEESPTAPGSRFPVRTIASLSEQGRILRLWQWLPNSTRSQRTCVDAGARAAIRHLPVDDDRGQRTDA